MATSYDTRVPYSEGARKVNIWNPAGELMWSEVVEGDEAAAWARAEEIDKKVEADWRIDLVEETLYIDVLGEFKRGVSAAQQMREREGVTPAL